MTISRRTLLGTAAAATLPVAHGRAQAQTIKIGLVTDQSGPYRDLSGSTSIACARQAIEDFDPANRGINVELLTADHQNKPDIGVAIVRQWIDRDKVDLILDVPHSGTALAVQAVVREKNKVYINPIASSSRLTGDQCSPNMLHWSFDGYMLARSTGGAMVKAGGDTWFFIIADYAFGQQLEKDTTDLVLKSGGKVSGRVAYPFPNTTDFS